MSKAHLPVVLYRFVLHHWGAMGWGVTEHAQRMFYVSLWWHKRVTSMHAEFGAN